MRHYLAFACKELGIDNIDSDLNHQIVRSTFDTEKKKFMVGLSMKVVENYTINNYARSMLHLLWYDAWHEGDGNRIMRCWKFFGQIDICLKWIKIPRVSLLSNHLLELL